MSTKGGRPSKRTPEREEKIIEALRAGNTKRAAAAAGGVGASTLFAWIAEFPEFKDAIERAEADAERAMVARVRDAAESGIWTAAAWWLERRRPGDFARREKVESKVELSGPDGGPIETVAGLSDHEKRALRDAIRERLAQEEAK
jgi:transposase